MASFKVFVSSRVGILEPPPEGTGDSIAASCLALRPPGSDWMFSFELSKTEKSINSSFGAMSNLFAASLDVGKVLLWSAIQQLYGTMPFTMLSWDLPGLVQRGVVVGEVV